MVEKMSFCQILRLYEHSKVRPNFRAKKCILSHSEGWFYITTTLGCHLDDLEKFSFHLVLSKAIKNLPVLKVRRWSLGGQEAS